MFELLEPDFCAVKRGNGSFPSAIVHERADVVPRNRGVHVVGVEMGHNKPLCLHVLGS